MIPLSKPTKLVESTKSHGVFEIEALYPGYGVTIANGLRRVLLSSLEGAAVTKVKIQGVEHEFSTLPDVLEDVIGILLSIKQMRFTMFSQEPQVAVLKVKGEKEVKASDFKFPSQVELVNGDLVLAHLTTKTAELDMEITIERGTGYVSAEDRSEGKQEIGILALDASFTPVVRVSYKVENMRVGERTDFDKVIVQVDTDGTVSPEQAFFQAADILVQQYEVVRAGIQKEATQEKEEPQEKKPAKKKASAKQK
jgi:DNA-directed RNA polymerase subunit alpha